jgi:tetratricopeptide (TPR) repeat protein
MHKEANTFFEAGKYGEAQGIFLKTGELYYQAQNFFDSTFMFYKAGECAYALKDYEKAAELFAKSADLSFQKGFDRLGVSALEYARDSYDAIDKKAKIKELEKKIKDVRKKLEKQF